jgi:hypothetical protein
MRSRQRGATFIGILIIVIILACGLYGAVRLIPLYSEYVSVVQVLEQTAKENPGATQQNLRNSLNRRWSVEDIHSLDWKDIEIKRAGSGFTLRAWYRAEAPFISNISLVVDFDKTVAVGNAPAAAAGT